MQACYIETAGEDARAAMQKLETALNDTHVKPRQPVSGNKAVIGFASSRVAKLTVATILEV
jgi:hypothetical protein